MAGEDRDGDKADSEQPVRMKGSLRDALAAAAAPPKPGAAEAPLQSAQPRPAQARSEHVHVEADAVSTRLLRAAATRKGDGPALTQRLRGKVDVKRVEFHQDPVVGWLVVVGGPGLGSFRPIFEGNNTVGRGTGQRIPIDFGDEAISNEEQAYIRYDSVDRTFLLVPNMAKTNIVAVNDQKPTSAVLLSAMDLITMGRTQLCFVPFCGTEFDWGELSEMKG